MKARMPGVIKKLDFRLEEVLGFSGVELGDPYWKIEHALKKGGIRFRLDRRGPPVGVGDRDYDFKTLVSLPGLRRKRGAHVFLNTNLGVLESATFFMFSRTPSATRELYGAMRVALAQRYGPMKTGEFTENTEPFSEVWTEYDPSSAAPPKRSLMIGFAIPTADTYFVTLGLQLFLFRSTKSKSPKPNPPEISYASITEISSLKPKLGLNELRTALDGAMFEERGYNRPMMAYLCGKRRVTLPGLRHEPLDIALVVSRKAGLLSLTIDVNGRRGTSAHVRASGARIRRAMTRLSGRPSMQMKTVVGRRDEWYCGNQQLRVTEVHRPRPRCVVQFGDLLFW